MPIKSSITALLAKSAGSSVLDTNRIRSSATVSPVDTANALTSVQQQLDQITSALQKSPTITEFEVTGPDGSLIAWIGNKVVGASSYLGAWFRQLYIGGTSAANAKIVADANGNVTINGATIVLNSNGVTTTINNVSTPPFGVLSIESLDNATGYFSGIDPFGVYLVDGAGNLIGAIRSGGGSGHISLSNVAGDKTIYMVTGGGGSPRLTVTGPSGASVVDDGKVDSPAFFAGGTAGVTGSDAFGTSVSKTPSSFVNSLSSGNGSFGTSITVNTATFVNGTPGVGQGTGAAVTSVTLNLGSAITSVSPGFADALIDVTLNTTPHTWKKGIVTS